MQRGTLLAALLVSLLPIVAFGQVDDEVLRRAKEKLAASQAAATTRPATPTPTVDIAAMQREIQALRGENAKLLADLAKATTVAPASPPRSEDELTTAVRAAEAKLSQAKAVFDARLEKNAAFVQKRTEVSGREKAIERASATVSPAATAALAKAKTELAAIVETETAKDPIYSQAKRELVDAEAAQLRPATPEIAAAMKEKRYIPAMSQAQADSIGDGPGMYEVTYTARFSSGGMAVGESAHEFVAPMAQPDPTLHVYAGTKAEASRRARERLAPDRYDIKTVVKVKEKA